MCTVTFIARKNGYALGMNRDEKLSRVQGLPPARHMINGRTAIFPSEPGGGTWVGVNDAGVTFALVNWYSVPARVSHNPVSRGEVTRSILAFDGLAAAVRHLADFPLKKTNPFRLIGVFPQNAIVLEWRWNLSHLARIEHEWRTNIWISSGFDEAGAQIARRETFERAMRNGKPHNCAWLRDVHASHEPTLGPYSVCMHRNDAASVSYTEVEISGSLAQLRYRSGTPCNAQPTQSKALKLPMLNNGLLTDLRRSSEALTSTS